MARKRKAPPKPKQKVQETEGQKYYREVLQPILEGEIENPSLRKMTQEEKKNFPLRGGLTVILRPGGKPKQ